MEISASKEVQEIFPNYGEFKLLKEASEHHDECKEGNHEERIVHHAFYTEVTSRGKEWYECWICPRCKEIQGKLVNITEVE